MCVRVIINKHSFETFFVIGSCFRTLAVLLFHFYFFNTEEIKLNNTKNNNNNNKKKIMMIMMMMMTGRRKKRRKSSYSAPNFWRKEIPNCFVCAITQSLALSAHAALYFWSAAPSHTFSLSPLFVRHAHAQNPTLQLWLLRFLTLRSPYIEQPPLRHQAN